MLKKISKNKVFGGWHEQYTFYSSSLNCETRFAIFLPPQANTQAVPVLYWLSGLTCTDENFMQKAGAFRLASELGMALVAPDTSPRGEGIPDASGEYDLGVGAGFYLNATQSPWRQNYHMFDYIVKELPALIEAQFPVSSHKSIAGHSMGGHGALVIALRHPENYMSASAFSPICNPIDCPWGQKAFLNYLGENRQSWLDYDACSLLSNRDQILPMRIDQGNDDPFLLEQLKPERLKAIAESKNFDLDLRIHDGYDHSYYFISSFIDEHLMFHAKHLIPKL